jgi:HSP20 family protein
MEKDETKAPLEQQSAAAASGGDTQAWLPLVTLRREIDRLFEASFLNPFRGLQLQRSMFDLEPSRQGGSSVAQPAMDLIERDNAYELTADMPGLDEKNIEVDVANGVLTVKGQKQEEKVEKEEDFHLHERRIASFSRSPRIPEAVDADKIEATFKNGLLKVTLPKMPVAQKPTKKIEVKGG